jgi:hypothetical protein
MTRGLLSINIWWGHLDLNQGPIGYAYHYNFHCPFRVCWSGLSLYPNWIPAIQSLHLFAQVVCANLARDYHENEDFPEFDRIYLPVTHVSSPFNLLAYLVTSSYEYWV